jgi:hypothetical protein
VHSRASVRCTREARRDDDNSTTSDETNDDMSRVQEIESDEDLAEAFKAVPPNTLIIVDFSASW